MHRNLTMFWENLIPQRKDLRGWFGMWVWEICSDWLTLELQTHMNNEHTQIYTEHQYIFEWAQFQGCNIISGDRQLLDCGIAYHKRIILGPNFLESKHKQISPSMCVCVNAFLCNVLLFLQATVSDEIQQKIKEKQDQHVLAVHYSARSLIQLKAKKKGLESCERQWWIQSHKCQTFCSTLKGFAHQMWPGFSGGDTSALRKFEKLGQDCTLHFLMLQHLMNWTASRVSRVRLWSTMTKSFGNSCRTTSRSICQGR